MKDIVLKAVRINKELDLKSYKGKNIYHNSKLLLQLYSKVLWRLESSLVEMEAECFEINYLSLLEAVGNLLGMDTELEKLNLESRLENLEISKNILVLINKALARLKTYPKDGERYHDILNRIYIINNGYSEDKILDDLGISRTTFYKVKKEAIYMLGVILWGFIIPEITNQHVFKAAETNQENVYNLVQMKDDHNSNQIRTKIEQKMN